MKKLLVLAALLIAALAAGPVLAQSLVGSVEGTVTDEQGGVLPGVTVTLSGKMGAKTAVTGVDGTYRFQAVEPGEYSVSAGGVSGFSTLRREDVRVNVAKASLVDFTMRVGGVTETVDVVAEAPVDVTSSATDNSLDQDFLFNLPISRTNAAVNTLNYLPGVTSTSSDRRAEPAWSSTIAAILQCDDVGKRVKIRRWPRKTRRQAETGKRTLHVLTLFIRRPASQR
jgi:hypothetical protein